MWWTFPHPMTEVKKNPEQRTYDEVIIDALAQHENPYIQVFAEYCRLTDSGKFDQEKVSKIVHETLIRRNTQYYRGVPEESKRPYPNTPFYDAEGLQLDNLRTFDDPIFAELLDEQQAFIIRKTNEINDRIAQKMTEVDKGSSVIRLKHLLGRIVKREQTAYVPYTNLEKSRYVQEQYPKRTIIDQDFLDPDSEHYVEKYEIKQDPVYKSLQGQTELLEKPQRRQDKEQPPSIDELQRLYIDLMTDLYEQALRATGKHNDPKRQGFFIGFVKNLDDLENDVFMTDSRNVHSNFPDMVSHIISEVELTDPELYLQLDAQNQYLSLLENYIHYYSTERVDETKEDITDALADPLYFLKRNKLRSPPDPKDPRHNDVNAILHIITWTQRLDKPELLKAVVPGSFGERKEGEVEITGMLEAATNKKRKLEIYKSQTSRVDKSLGTIDEYLKDLNAKPYAIMVGDPMHVAQFPDRISVYPHPKDSSEKFSDYATFSEGLQLQSQVTVESAKAFVLNENSSDAIDLALPQYAPVVNIRAYAPPRDGMGNRVEYLLCGQDYRLLYESKTGHYRMQLLTERAKSAGQTGIMYEASLDFVEKQKDIPRQVDTVDISTQRLNSLCRSLEQAGFGLLSEKLKETLKVGTFDRVKSLFTGEKFQRTSEDVARAIRDSITYGFDKDDADLQTANAIIASGVSGELDFSFLPDTNKGRKAKIEVQCRHVAKLYSMILNYLYDQSGSVGEVSSSHLMADVNPTETVLKGFRVFTMGHADTQGIFTDAQETVRFQQDLTPRASGSNRDLIDAAKKQNEVLLEELTQVRRELNGKLSPEDAFYVEIASGDVSFSEFIIRLKRDVGAYIPEYKGDSNKIAKFAEDPPTLKDPSEFINTLKTKPLAAVLNILWYFQAHGKEALQNEVAMSPIKKVLQTEVELFTRLKNRENHNVRKSPQDASFIDELVVSSRIAEKLIQLIEGFERVEEEAEEEMVA